MGRGDTTAEIIADGNHVHPSAIHMAYQAMGPERLCLISDALSPAGLPMRNGESKVVGGIGPVTYADKRLTTQDNTLAGSAICLLDGVRVAITQAKVPITHAFEMATSTPARLAGLAQRKGSLAQGMDADLILLNNDLSLVQAYVKGKAAQTPS